MESFAGNPKRGHDVGGPLIPLKKKTVINRMANLKKKLKELTILCDTQGFLVCTCPALGTQIWPEDPDDIVSRIQQFRETKSRKAAGGNGALMIVPTSGTQTHESMLERLLISSKQSDDETRLQNLLQCITGRRRIDDFELAELRQSLLHVEDVKAFAHKGLTETKNKIMEIDLNLKL